VKFLSFSSHLIVGAADADADVAAETAETDADVVAAAAFEGEFVAVETVVQLKECA